MADDTTQIRGTIELREIDGKTKRVIVCDDCCEVAAEFAEHTQISRLLLKSTLNRHLMLRRGRHEFNTYVRAENKMLPGVILKEYRNQ